MFRATFLALSGLVLVAPAPGISGEPEARLRVELEPASPTYVIGEPLGLTVNVTNVSAAPIKCWEVLVQETEPEIAIFMARDAGPFSKYRMGIYPTAKVERGFQTLRPGIARRYSMRLLYSINRPRRLAFEEPGRFLIKANYPLITAGPKGGYQREDWESNTVSVRIVTPMGEDVKVWKELNEPHILYFLQSGRVLKGHEDVCLRLAELVKSIPNSSYHEELLWALRQYYHRERRNRHGARKLEHDDLFREVLGIEDGTLYNIIGEAGPDRRLDLEQVDYHYPNDTPIIEVVDDAYRQTGVPLKVDPGIHETSRFRSDPKTVSLRQFMQSLIDPGRTTWVREGDGYVLKPIDNVQPGKSRVPNDSKKR